MGGNEGTHREKKEYNNYYYVLRSYNIVEEEEEEGRDLCGFIQLTVMHSSFHRRSRRVPQVLAL